MEASTKPSTPTSPPTTTTTPTRRPSRFTEDIFGHDLTRITSHDYDCALGIEGGNCEHITIEGIDPTSPDTWDLIPMTLSSCLFSSSSDADDEASGSDARSHDGYDWGDSTLQVDGEEARHAEAMAKFGSRGRSGSRSQSQSQARRRSWGGILVFVEAVRRKMRFLEGRKRRWTF